jgi:hypothetical protein
MPSVKNVFGCVQSDVCTVPLTSSLFANQCPYNICFSGQKLWQSDGVRSGLYTGGEAHFNSCSYSMRLSTVIMQNNSMLRQLPASL